MHVGIDASNISSGGGVTHLLNLLNEADPLAYGFSEITVWAGKGTASVLPERSWLKKQSPDWTEKGFVQRFFTQQFKLPKLVKEAGCDVLFSPGGTLPICCDTPKVTMSQNMLPFEASAAALFGRLSLMRLKMRLLRSAQRRSFKRADGIIFLSTYAKAVIDRAVNGLDCLCALVPHGIETRFFQAPRPQRSFEGFTVDNPFRLLYVSVVMPYKHQVEVAAAVAKLKSAGFPIECRFVGASWGNYGAGFSHYLTILDPVAQFLKWEGHVPFENLHTLYGEADGFVFASSCENLPNILIEAMAEGLPIACSNRGPMPEVLGEAGVYFDPADVDSIADCLLGLGKDQVLRTRLAEAAWKKAQAYSWKRCANDTFDFIAQVARVPRRK